MTARLAYLLKKFPRTSETFILNEILAQENLGREIRVFSRRPPDDEPRHPQLAQLKAEVEEIPGRRELDPWEILFGGEDPEATFARVGRVVRTAREWNHPRFPSLLTEALWLWGRTRELGIEHVHTHFATDSAVVALLLKELGGPTYSVTMHAKDIYRSTVDPTMLDRLIADSAFVVTVCDANVRYIAERVGEEAQSRLRRLYNGIDLGNFRYHESPRDEDHVLSVGRLVEKKGFHVLIDAIALLKERGKTPRVTIVGEGDQREALEQQIQARGLADQIHLTGACDSDAVRDLMERATVMCLPCIVGEDGNRDALPTVLLEALAVGLPSISTPVTGIPEILDDGKAGVIVPEHSPEETAQALENLLADAKRREEIARAGHIRAQQCFDRAGTSAILDGWFEKVTARGSIACA